jgi:hypothetical protein
MFPPDGELRGRAALPFSCERDGEIEKDKDGKLLRKARELEGRQANSMVVIPGPFLIREGELHTHEGENI